MRSPGCAPAPTRPAALGAALDFLVREERLTCDLHDERQATEVLSVKVLDSAVPVLLRLDLDVAEALALVGLPLLDNLHLDWVIGGEVLLEPVLVNLLRDVADENVILDDHPRAGNSDTAITAIDRDILGVGRLRHLVSGLEIDEAETTGNATAPKRPGHDASVGNLSEATKLRGKLLVCKRVRKV